MPSAEVAAFLPIEEREDLRDALLREPCPYCEGAGEYESEPYGIDYRDGSLLCHGYVCHECGGCGWRWEGIALRDQDDIEFENEEGALEALAA